MELTEQLRQTFLLVVCILALICFFSSFMLFSCAAYIKIKVDARMQLIETYNSNVLPAIFLFVGVINLAQNVTCLFVCLKMRSIENREGMMKMLLPVLIGGAVLVVFEVSTAIASFVHISILDDEFEAGLKKAMSEYVNGKELKLEMDSVQSEYGCCGDVDYTDWFEYSWLDPQFLKASTRGARRYFQTDGKYYSDDTPFSCCDVHSPRPCIHHHVNDNSKHHNYNYEVETTLYVRGCRPVLMEIYGRVLCTVAVIALLIATVKTTALLLFRLLQTSFVFAQDEGDWEATTPAYIYYLQPPDADLEQKKLLEGGTSDSEASKSNTESSTENLTDENTNNDTEYDDDDHDAAAGTTIQSNTNYSDHNYAGGVDNFSHNKSAGQPTLFGPVIPGTGYLQDDNLRLLSNADDMILQKRLGKQPLASRSGSFVAGDSYTQCLFGNDNSIGGDANGYVAMPCSEIDPHKVWNERNRFGSDQYTYPTQGVSEAGLNDSRAERGNALVSSDTCLGSSEAAGKQVTFESQKSRLPGDYRGFAGRLLSRLTGSLKPQKKYSGSSKGYKYSLVNTHSESDEQEEEDGDEEAEEGEEEEEEEEGDEEAVEEEEEKAICSSEEEYGTHITKNIGNKRYKLLCGATDREEEFGSTKHNYVDSSLKTENTKSNVPQQEQCRTSEIETARGNERYQSKDNTIYSQKYYPRRLKDTQGEGDIPLAANRDAAPSSSRASMSSYHEVNEKSGEYKMKQPKNRNYAPRPPLEAHSCSVAKNNLLTRESRPLEELMSKSVSLPGTAIPAEDTDVANSQTHTELYVSTSNKRHELGNQDQALPSRQEYNPSTGWSNPSNDTSYVEQGSKPAYMVDQTKHSVHWPKHNQLAELAGTTESSETDYEAANNGSGDDINPHRRKFIGRYTPYPYDVMRHKTFNSGEDDTTPTNTRKGKEIAQLNIFNQFSRDTIDIAELSSTDVPESDIEVSSFETAAATYNDPYMRNQQDEIKQLSHAQVFSKNNLQLAKPQLQKSVRKADKPNIVSHSREGLSSGCRGKEDCKKMQLSRTNIDHGDPRMDMPLDFKSVATPFAFPLMQPSPSSFEMSSSVRNHIRSYQRRSVFLASPLSHSRVNSPISSSSPHIALFSSPLLDSPMETSTPIICTKHMWDSIEHQTVTTAERDPSSTKPSHQNKQGTRGSDPLLTGDTPQCVTADSPRTRQAWLPDLFPAMSDIDRDSLGVSNQLLAVEGTLLIDEVYTSSEVCDVVHSVKSTEESSSKSRVLISPFN